MDDLVRQPPRHFDSQSWSTTPQNPTPRTTHTGEFVRTRVVRGVRENLCVLCVELDLGVRHPKIQLHAQHTQVLTNSTHNTGSCEKFSRTRLCALCVELDFEKFSRTRRDTRLDTLIHNFVARHPKIQLHAQHTHTCARTHRHTPNSSSRPPTLLFTISGYATPKSSSTRNGCCGLPSISTTWGKKNSSKFRGGQE